MYTILLCTHVTCVVVSISLFMARGTIRAVTGTVPDHALFRVMPHVVDTLLLLSALSLTVQIDQYPFINSWLTVKFFATAAYIIFGTLALKLAASRSAMVGMLCLSLLLFSFIASVAWYHNPLGFFLLLQR